MIGKLNDNGINRITSTNSKNFSVHFYTVNHLLNILSSLSSSNNLHMYKLYNIAQ